jgi:hypothetical protein
MYRKSSNKTFDVETLEDLGEDFSTDISIDEDVDGFSEEEFEDETYDGFETSFNDNAQIQKIWLDADPYLNNIYLSITNQEVKQRKYTDSHGNEKIKKDLEQIKGTRPLANNLGVSQIMGFIRGIFSKEIVMGNIDRQQYNTFMKHFSCDIMKMLITNRLPEDWDIKINDVEIIHKIIINGANFYLTRPIGDGERRSSRARPDVNESKPSGFLDSWSNKFKKQRGRT